ncbi:MAG: RNHCP domain-containing protein [Candidatus Nealsonbacteria bacterium]|jgi:radical SAM protein with 4Fe4S-binding SPASM domain|nr:RNHCP domain-containing protein [Candidatus Nealsonbacteria bacterium]
MAKRFSRCRENFICENCGKKVIGNGYTNHCPSCLYGKHVDINPGDRQNKCFGLMEPIGVEVEQGEYILTHRCLKCGTIKRNRSASNDSFETILDLVKKSQRGRENMKTKLTIPSIPHLVHIETTYACNSRCIFCYNPKRGEGFNREKIDRIVQSIYESWIPHVYLIGGEPSLLGVNQLNAYINLLAERSSVTIVTNGLICLKGLSKRLACIGIPFHGIKEIHEWHTEIKGGFKKTVASTRYYIENGFDVRCIPVLTAWNFDQMYEVIRLAKQLGMESVFVDRFEDGGIGSKRSKEIAPTIEQFRIALSQMIAGQRDFGIPVGFGTAIPFCLDERLITENMFADCGVGFTFAAVNPRGDVRLCNQSEIVYGNVLEKPIEQIWKKKQLDEFRDLRWVTEPCRSCRVLTECLCGCKVDCSYSTGYCVDYAVRGLNKPLYPVSGIPRRNLPSKYPKYYRYFSLDPYTKLNVFHREPYLVTRYQTIEIDNETTEVMRVIINGETNEKALVTRFAGIFDEKEIRSFVTKLAAIKAIRITD